MTYTGSQAFIPPAGTKFSLNTGTLQAPVLVDISEVNSIGPSGRKYDVEDTTNLSSTAKEKLATLLDSGQIEIDYNYLQDTAQQALESAFVAGGVHQFQITIPGFPGAKVETWAFAAIIVDKNVDTMQRSKVLKAKVKLDVTGSFTFTLT